MSTMKDYLLQMEHLYWLAALILVAAGVVYVLAGWRIYRYLVMANAMAIGVVVGSWIGQRLNHPNMDIIVGIAAGLLLAAAAWPLMRFGVALMAALVGAGLGMALWRYAMQAGGQEAGLVKLWWPGAIIGAITMGLLAFIVAKAMVIAFTSFQGSAMLVSGVVALLVKSAGIRATVENGLTTNAYLPPLLVLVPAVIGAMFQWTKFGKGGGGGGGSGG